MKKLIDNIMLILIISIKRKTQLSQQLCEQIQSNITNRKENITAVIKWEELLENLRR